MVDPLHSLPAYSGQDIKTCDKYPVSPSPLFYFGGFMKADCQDYSKSMELLSLKTRLEKGISDPKKREEVLDRIEILERELNLD
jgi:hypothetical protein